MITNEGTVQQHLKIIFNLPCITKECLLGLSRILDSFLQHTRALKAFGRSANNWDDLFIYLIITKIDTLRNKKWGACWPSSVTVSTFADIIKFLIKKCQILEGGCRGALPNVSVPCIKCQTSYVSMTRKCIIYSGDEKESRTPVRHGAQNILDNKLQRYN